MKSKTITLAQLRAAGACADQRAKFKELFGSSVEVSVELCVKHADDFDWSFAAEKFLSATALAEYNRVCATALAEYNRVCAPARAEYDRVRAPAWAEYDRVRAPAWAEYNRVCAQARAEYNRVRAPAWATAFINQE